MPVHPTVADVEADGGPNLRLAEANNPSSKVLHLPESEPLRLACDQLLAPISIAYETYGTLNADKSNAVLVCHALTGDQYVASEHPVTGKPGWWSTIVGPGKPIDTDRFFVICPNILGGCMGSTGPASIDPQTGKPYGLNFPVITIGDMVRAQVRLIDHLGIDQLFCVIGGSMGGMQVLEWAASHSERVFSAVPIATAAWHSAQNIAFHEVGRQAVMADPDWCGGDYHSFGKVPRNGLAVARMAAHITYLSEDALQRKFGRNLQERSQGHVLVRRRLPGGELSAPPGRDVRRPLRRQHLSLHHAGDGLFRPRRRARRRAGQRLPRHARRASASSRSRATGSIRRARAARSCTRSTPLPPTSRSSRSRATTATTPSCSRSRSSSRPFAGS